MRRRVAADVSPSGSSHQTEHPHLPSTSASSGQSDNLGHFPSSLLPYPVEPPAKPTRSPIWTPERRENLNRTIADGQCHLTAINYNTEAPSIVRLSLPPKPVVNARVHKLSQLPIDAVEALGGLVKASKSPPKQLQQLADKLSNKLEPRLFPASPTLVRHIRQEILNEIFADYPAFSYEYNVLKNRPVIDIELQRLVRQRLARRHFGWKPLKFKDDKAALIYALSRFPSHFAEMKRVLAEFDRNGFVPTKVLDYGSGIGSAFWAAFERWGDQVMEYSLIDKDQSIRHFSMDLLRGRNFSGSGQLVSRNLFFRKALFPSPRHTYDLVILHRTLAEMESHEQRVALVEQLWKRTNKYLVIVDSSMLGAFQALNKIRDHMLTAGYDFDARRTKELLYEHGKLDQETIELFADRRAQTYQKYCRARELLPDDVPIPTRLKAAHVFAPCPHDNACPLMARREACKFTVRWQEFRADHRTRSKARDGTEAGDFCYLILAKGQRPPAAISADGEQPRLLELNLAHRCVSCRVCTPNDGVQRFVAGKRMGKIYARIRRSLASQLLPVKFDMVKSGHADFKQITAPEETEMDEKTEIVEEPKRLTTGDH